MRSFFLLGLVFVATLAATPGPQYQLSTTPAVDETTLQGPAGLARLRELKGFVKLKDGHVVSPALLLRVAGRKAPGEPSQSRSLMEFNKKIAVVGSAATALRTSAGATVFSPNEKLTGKMHLTSRSMTEAVYVTPAVFSVQQNLATVKLPPQQTDACASTLCTNFSSGTATAEEVAVNDLANNWGTGSLLRNPDGSYMKAPDGNCYSLGIGFPATTSEVACPGTSVNVLIQPCSVDCAPQHFHISIMDTWVFDHYETDANSACNQGFTITPEVGSDDGVAHTLYIHVTYAPGNPKASLLQYQIACNINVFIKGPQGSDWGA